MSVVVTGYDQVAVRAGVFYRPDGWSATSLGLPFGHFTFGAVGCSLTAAGPARQAPRTFAWRDVVGAESTRFGVRFNFAVPAEPVEIATMRQAERLRLVEAARTYCPAGTFEDHTTAADAEESSAHRPSVWMRAIQVRVPLATWATYARRRQPEQT